MMVPQIEINSFLFLQKLFQPRLQILFRSQPFCQLFLFFGDINRLMPVAPVPFGITAAADADKFPFR